MIAHMAPGTYQVTTPQGYILTLRVYNSGAFAVRQGDGTLSPSGNFYVKADGKLGYRLVHSLLTGGGEGTIIARALEQLINRRLTVLLLEKPAICFNDLPTVLREKAEQLAELNKQLELQFEAEGAASYMLGFEYEGIFVVDPFLCENTLEKVDPVAYYGQAFINSIFCLGREGGNE